MPSRWKERERAIMNGLMSLIVNECDALECLKKQGTEALYEGIACKVRPTLQVCAEEATELTRQRDSALKDAETKRFALESVASNVGNLPLSIKTTVERALPGRKL